ncbi:hypothetical protein D3C77_272480 [compost metagenome]
MNLQEIKENAYNRGLKGWNTTPVAVKDLLDIIFELESLQRRNKELSNRLAGVYPFKPAQDAPTIGYTGCLICGVFTDHGGLQCPKLRAYSWCNSSPENS